ncbi:hypothetical protein ScPMuIL_018044 [Solemya velum]
MTGMFPEPRVFYENFVKPGQPLLLRDALNSIEFPAFQKWTDHYLREKFGEEMVEVEKGKKEDRDRGMEVMKFKEFIKFYESADIYMVHTLPASMEGDITVPVTLQCGGFSKALQDLVVWFSNGGTKSVLHSDYLDNINCLLDGKKDFIFIDKEYADLVEANGFDQEKSYSTVDVDRVDFVKFPRLREVPWLKATLQKGDCIYIPYRWYHQVNSHESRNLAVNFWFTHLWWMNATHCDGKDLMSGPVPLNQLNITSSNEFPRSQFLQSFSKLKKVTVKDFFTELELDGGKRDRQFFNFIDENNDGTLTWEELYTFNIDTVLRRFPDILGLTENNHYSDYSLEGDTDTDTTGDDSNITDHDTDADSLEDEDEDVMETKEEL